MKGNRITLSAIAAVVVLLSVIIANAGDEASWGKPSEGLKLGLSLEHPAWGYGAEGEIRLQFKNVSEDAIEMLHLKKTSIPLKVRHDFNIQYCPVGTDRWQRAQWGFPGPWQGDPTQTIKPVKTASIAFPAAQAYGFSGYAEYAKPPRYLIPWPPMPGKYRLRIMYKAMTPREGGKHGIWTGVVYSGECRLEVKPYAFLKGKENPKVKTETIETLITEQMNLASVAYKLAEMEDPRANRAMLMLLRCQALPKYGCLDLGRLLGDAITPDLLRCSGAYGWIRQNGCGEALGRIGTKKVIVAVRPQLGRKDWYGREGFIRGLALAKTKESLDLLTELSVAGDRLAAFSLVLRKDKGAKDAKLKVMTKGKSPAADIAAQSLALEGEMKAVRWLAEHMAWVNASAFVNAPVQWPAPKKNEISKKDALAAATKINFRFLFRKPVYQAFCLDGKWYVISVSGHPQKRGHFACVIIDAATGKILKKLSNAAMM